MSKLSRPFKLMTLLESLSNDEIYELGRYLRQHSVATKSDKLNLYAYLRKNWLEVAKEDRHDITNKQLQKYIFKKNINNNDKINNLNSQLVKDIKDFLIEKEVKTNELTKAILLGKALKKRGLDESFFKHNRSSIATIHKSQPTFEAVHYDALYTLMHDVTFHRGTSKLNTNHEELLIETETYLDQAYILRKLQLICEQTTRTLFIQSNDNVAILSIDFEEDILEKFDTDLIRIYLQIIALYDKKSFDIYQEIKGKIMNLQLTFSNFTRMAFVRLMINYCHKKYSEDKATYLQEICDLYYFAYQNDLLIEDRYMSEVDYLNLIKITLTSKDLKDDETLIGKSRLLKPEYRENGKLLATAMFRFKQEKYEDAQKLLVREVSWRDIHYKLTAHSLLIQTLYEVFDYEQLKKQIRSSRQFIKSDATLSQERKATNQAFFDFIIEIARHKAASTSKTEVLALDLLRQPIIHGEWCAAKLAELTA